MLMRTLPKHKLFLIISFILICVMMFSCILNLSTARASYIYDTNDFKLSRYWQGLNNTTWSNWFIDYYLEMLNTHDTLYKSTQQSGKGNYFKSGIIKYRPLYIWFVYENGTITRPTLVKSSGCTLYDEFYKNVILKTVVPEFPEKKERIFMWDGETSEVLMYLKRSGVLPVDYQLGQPITQNQIQWDRI